MGLRCNKCNKRISRLFNYGNDESPLCFECSAITTDLNKNTIMQEPKHNTPKMVPATDVPKYINILNVDDELQIVELVSLFLNYHSKTQINVISFTHCPDCITYCEQNSTGIDFIITGYCMPLYSGTELLQKLDTIFNKNIPVVMHSGMMNDDPGLVKRFYDLELNNIIALSFLPKPIPLKVLVGLVFP